MPNSTITSLLPFLTTSRPGLSDGNPGAITARPQQTFLKTVLLMAGTFCLLLGAIFLGSRHAYAALWTCNKTNKDLRVFLAYPVRSSNKQEDDISNPRIARAGRCFKGIKANLGERYKKAIYVAAVEDTDSDTETYMIQRTHRDAAAQHLPVIHPLTPRSLGNKGRMPSTCSVLSPNNWAITHLLLVLSWGSLSAERVIPHIMSPDPNTITLL